MKVLLVVLDPKLLPPGTLAEIQLHASDYEVIVTKDRETIRSRLQDIEIAVGRFPHSLLSEAKNLRWYQQYGAGADWLDDRPKIDKKDFLLTSASGIHPIPITEHIMAFLLCFARGFSSSILGQAGRVWEKNRWQPLFELDGKRVVLLGVGAIGSRFARVAAAFGMEVVGVRRSAGEPVAGTIRTVTSDKLDEELSEADFLINCLPLTSETRHIVDARRLALLKPTAYMINVGRGATVNEQDLIKALQSKRIAGAGLDVFETEPLPDDSPLWDMENVIITPHYSGITPRYIDRLLALFLDNLDRYLEGRPMRNVVDLERGY